jgi:hypothetical protein
MRRLELTFLHLASGGGCNSPGKGQKYQLQRSFSHGITPARVGLMWWDPVLSGSNRARDAGFTGSWWLRIVKLDESKLTH